jgi:hypothetical protein
MYVVSSVVLTDGADFIVIQRLSEHNLKFRSIAIFKNCVKQNNIQIKLVGMAMIVCYTKVHLSKCYGS